MPKMSNIVLIKRNRQTPLFIASRHDSIETTKLLIESEADVNAKDT